LLGIGCRYDGDDNFKEEMIKELKFFGLVPICPEQMGGLTTPRDPAEIVSESPFKIASNQGADVTEAFRKGAEECVKMANRLDCKFAVLKSKSPSCGSKEIYDGTFSGELIQGKGLTCRMLEAEGIKVFSEKNYHEMVNLILTLFE